MNLTFQRHNIPFVALFLEMVRCSIMLRTQMSDCQSHRHWYTEIGSATSRFPTYWYMSQVYIFGVQLTNSQIVRDFKNWPLN
jgi:hypothetical protein